MAEWENMFERLGLAEHNDEGKAHHIPDEAWTTEDDDGIKHMEIEIQLWGSLRGQTLARVIHGVMQFEQGCCLFAKQEHERSLEANPGLGRSPPRNTVPPGSVWRDDPIWMREAHAKYGYVISCQIFGTYMRKQRSAADNAKFGQICLLLKLFPHLRIAYTDEHPKNMFYSCFFAH